MNLSELIALAKAGYKKKDIDELLKLDVTPEPEPEEPAQENGPREDAEAQPAGEESPVNDEIENEELNAAREEIDKLKKDLDLAQSLNRLFDVTQNMDDKEERDKRIREFARELM